VGRDLLLCIIRVMECGRGWVAVIKLSKLIDYMVEFSFYHYYRLIRKEDYVGLVKVVLRLSLKIRASMRRTREDKRGAPSVLPLA